MSSPRQTFAYKSLDSIGFIRVLDWIYDENGRPTYQLREVDLDSQPVSKALSYTWDLNRSLTESEQTSLTQCIEINGLLMPIGANLEQALNRIHEARQSAPIWIDALCINQADLEERARQVKLMGRIFSSAAVVIAWLGKDPVPPRTLAFIEELPHIELQKSFDQLNLTHCEDVIRGMRETRYSDWLGGADLLGCAWFSRVWIIQEAVLAKQLVVYKGHCEISWSQLYNLAILVLTVFRHNLNSHSLRDVSHTWVGSIATIFHIREARKNGTKWPFLKCLDFSRAHGATDPRDKIFALLPLTSWADGLYPALLEPNYQLDSVHAYTACAQHLIETTCGLDILCSVSDKAMCTIQDLPSWVPDFSVELSPRPLGGDARSCYDVCLLHPKTVSMKAGILKLQAMIIDTVGCIGPGFEDLLLHPKPNAILELLGVLPANALQYASEEPLVDVLWRTLCANAWLGSFPAPDSLRKSFLSWLSSLLFIVLEAGYSDHIHRFLFTFEHQMPSVRENIEHLRLGNSEEQKRIEEQSKTFSIQFAAMYEDRRIFRTRRNLLGISSKSVCVGDQVHLLAGAGLPVCLRELHDRPALSEPVQYQFIGESYLHGLMQGTDSLLPHLTFRDIELR